MCYSNSMNSFQTEQNFTFAVVSVTHAPLEVVSDAVMSVGVGDRIATLPVPLLDTAVTVSAAPRPRRPRTPPTVDWRRRYHYKGTQKNGLFLMPQNALRTRINH